MKSRRYCPKCNSFNIKRGHRSPFQKYVLLVSGLYLCENCDLEFTDKQMNKNELKERKKFNILAQDEKVNKQETMVDVDN